MKLAATMLFAAGVSAIGAGQNVSATLVDFNFTISYSGSSITGRLVGLNLDENGNGTEVDPSSVLIFTAPAIVQLPASPGHPYVFVPHTFERSTPFNGTFSSTTPGVYGFQVSNYTITPAQQNLLMMEAGNDVTLVFNFGQGFCGECGTATYGIMAEEDALWPAINSFVSFTPVAVPTGGCCSGGNCTVMTASACAAGGGTYKGNGTDCSACVPVCSADIAPAGLPDGQVNISDLTQVILNWGTSNADADINHDGQVNITDLTAVILAWGSC